MDQKLKEEAMIKLREIINEKNDDPEDAHVAADAVLTDLLTKLGYQEVVDLYESIYKYYA